MGVFVWTLAVYKDIYGLRFFLDDYLHLLLIRRIDNPIAPFTTDFMFGAFYRPGVFWLWKLNEVVGGLNPSWYYAFNMALLFILCLLLMQYLQHLTGYKGYAAWTTALFAVSPITAQGMLWLSNRFDLLGAVFFFASAVLFVRSLRFHRRWDMTVSVALGVFSYFCKEIYITLPAILILSTLFMFHYRGELTLETARRAVMLSLPFFIAAALFMVIRYAILGTMGGYVGEERVEITFTYLMSLLASFGNYVWFFAWPLVTAAVLLLAAALWMRRHPIRNNPLALFGLVFAAVTASPLLMVLSVEKVMTYHTARFFFLPGIGLVMMAASVYNPRSDRRRRIFAAVYLALNLLFASANTFLVTHHTGDETRRSEKQLTRIVDFLEKNWDKSQPSVIYACQRGLDVALDSSLKVRFPEFADSLYLLNCWSQTQVAASEGLYETRGGDLNFPTTFTKNPSRFKDLVYGVVEVKPKDVLADLGTKEYVKAIYKNRRGELTWIDTEDLRGQMETLGAVFE